MCLINGDFVFNFCSLVSNNEQYFVNTSCIEGFVGRTGIDNASWLEIILNNTWYYLHRVRLM